MTTALATHADPPVMAVHPLGEPGAPEPASGLPTRRDEAWRYADLGAVADLWPVPAPDRVTVTHTHHRAIVIDEPLAIRDLVIAVAPGATCTIDILNLATRYGRVAIDVTMGAGASFTLNAVQIGRPDATVEVVTTLRHIDPGATSQQTVRSVLGARATGSFLGKVAVARDAQQTDASQSVRAMLLDRTATANAKPELEIYADDVKCAHGAAIGELDANALYYLQMRGIDPVTARALLLEAFVGDVLRDPALAERARAALRAL